MGVGVSVSVGGPAGPGGELVVGWLRVPSGGCVKSILPRSAPVSACTAPWSAGRSGLSYLTFHVDDVNPVVAVPPGAGGCRIGFWADPEGNVVELVDERGDGPGPRRSN